MEIISNMIEAHIFSEIEEGLKFLLLKRSDKVIYPGIWQPVTGKIKKNETAYEAAIREIKEETGIVPKKLWVIPNINTFYNHNKDVISFIPVFGVSVEVNTKIKISNEHCQYGWFTPEESKKLLAWPGQKKSVEIISEYVINKKYLLNLLEVDLTNKK